ncbi:MAG: 50S ribosomal protein L18 [Proteobacteria bacterium]|jgi:large subunit ribosomal protein L18|nr:50S ribosomal protein L18 [Pseudomonadota bacterium]
MSDKKSSRLRRARKTRAKIARFGVDRLSVHRTPRHIYAQIIDASGEKVVASASTIDKTLRKSVKYGGNVEAAKAVGKRIAELAKKAGIKKAAFDRSGFRYHGRVQALADAAREAGLKI